MVLACGVVREVTVTRANGNSANLKAMECIPGQMVIITKASSNNVLSMVRVFKDLQMAICIKADISMASLPVTESTIGSMAAISRAISLMG
jgi:hypothetical protein